MCFDDWIEPFLENDDITGHLFNECMVKLMNREYPTADEIEAANLELQNVGLKICPLVQKS